MAEYQTTFLRAVLAVGAGAVAGAAMVTVWFLAGASDLNYLRQYGFQAGVLIFINATVIWALGLVLVGAPLWAILHYYGKRNWTAAGALGAILTFVVTLGLLTNGFGLLVSGNLSASDAAGPIWVDSQLTAHGWAVALEVAVVCCIAGALVGLIVWRVAYRPVKV